jgi:hypothetical protein
MQDKQKVTLYLPPDLHRQLKIRAAVDAEPMSVLAERAICFYLSHSDVVESMETHGATHRIYHCPACETPAVLRNGEMQSIGQPSKVIPDELVDLSQADKELLVPC